LAWKIDYTADARRSLARLDKAISARIIGFMERRVAALNDPTQIGERLKGELRPFWRYRVGDYRVVCDLKKEIITVLVVRVGHRREIYR
jgi:mRNA interferase RelE/StbE